MENDHRTASAAGPRCGNNPNVRLSPGDQQAVDAFKAYLKERADALRDRIAGALYAHDHPTHVVPLNETGMGPAYRESADAVLAVLPAPALVVARRLLGTTEGEDEPDEREPVQLRWGLDDVMYGDDDTTTVLLSGPGREPYWVELDPERTAALRDALAGPAAPPAPADRAAVLRAEADRIDARYEATRPRLAAGVAWATSELRLAAGEAPAPTPLADRVAIEALAAEWEKRGEYGDSSITDRARELRAVLAGEAAAGVQQTTTSEAHPEGCTCGPHVLARYAALATPPAAPAAPEEPTR